MTHPALVLLVRLKSALPLAEIRQVMDSRIGEFRALDGLTQKYYLRDPATGEIAGLYLWESTEALSEFSKSELKQTIADAYQVVGQPRIESYEVLEVLRDAG